MGHKKAGNLETFRLLGGYFLQLHLIAILIVLTSCAATQPLPVEQAQRMVTDARQIDRHEVWALDWPAAPVGGPVTVETWRAGNSFRYEILEAVAPALIGEILVFNGQTAWQYNRFDSVTPAVLDAPRLSPVSDAFAVIEHLSVTTPQSATWEAAQTVHGPAQKISLNYTGGDQLVMWRDVKTQLPVKIVFSVNGQQATLKARNFEPLVNPSARLFTVP